MTGGRITLKPFIERHPMSRGTDVLQRVADHALTRRAILEPDWSVRRETSEDREPAGRNAGC